jgi:rhodanese-related sulfurtransferase
MKKIISGVLVLLLLLVSSSVVAYAELTPPLPGVPTYDISVEEAHKMLAETPGEIILLDVRTEGEYNAEYIDREGVELINIPKDALESRIAELDKSKAIIVYCRSGGRSSAAKNTLAQHDFVVYNMLGGINAWKGKFDTAMSTAKDARGTTSPTVSPVLTPTATPTPVTSPIHTSTSMPKEEEHTPGFGLILALAAITLIAWHHLSRKQ